MECKNQKYNCGLPDAYGQLRQVVKIETDESGRVRISYNSKSSKIAGRDFEPWHTDSTPPLDETFKRESGRMLSDVEIQDLIKSGILKRNELFF
jgi:hypothetical protein